MNASTQFPAEVSNGDQTDLVAVLLLENGRRPFSHSLLECCQPGFHRQVFLDLPVDKFLDLPYFDPAERREMGEIEAQPFRRHERAGLFDMVAEDLAKRGVEEMSSGVVIPDSPPPGGIDGGLDPVTDPKLAAEGFHLVGDKLRNRKRGPVDKPGEMGTFEAAGVPDLASRFGIKR